MDFDYNTWISINEPLYVQVMNKLYIAAMKCYISIIMCARDKSNT